MAAFRFVHAADIHLDSPLRSLALRSPELASLVDNATRRAFVNTIDLCLDEQVDALLLAGDLYDGDQTSMKTALFLAKQLRRLDEAKIRVFLIRGNHDAMSRITRELVMPPNVHIFQGRPEAIQANADLPVYIHGLSFAERHAPTSLLGKFKPPVAGAINIGLLHTSLAGSAGHDLYAPCSLADLQVSGFQYWALGHIHARSVYTGDCIIVMPGMPQGRDIGEAGPKSVTLVTVSPDGGIQIEERSKSVAQFERLTIDATGVQSRDQLLAKLRAALELCRQGTQVESLIVRVQFTGATPLAWQMRRDPDLLKAEADNCADSIGKCWIEKLDVDCQPPRATVATAHDPIIELQSLIADQVLQSDAFLLEASKLVSDFQHHLPPECRAILGNDEAASRLVTQGLASAGATDVLARLAIPGAA